MEFREIYCASCKKTLGRYNIKFYNEDKIKEFVNIFYLSHIRSGHQIIIKKSNKKNLERL